MNYNTTPVCSVGSR